MLSIFIQVYFGQYKSNFTQLVQQNRAKLSVLNEFQYVETVSVFFIV